MVSGIVRAGTSFWALLILCVTGVFLMAWIGSEPASGTVPDAAPTVEEARAFTAAAEVKLLDLWVKSARASWVQNTYITEDTQRIGADADLAVKSETAKLAAEARRFDGLQLPEDVARKLKLIRLSVDIPAPHDPAEAAELASIDASLQGDYGKGKWCPDAADASKCLNLDQLEKVMAASRDPEELKRAWIGWHAIAPPMRERYERMVVLGNKGARELGFADMGAQWRSNYDMPPDKFAAEVERLWQQVRPLYESLHAYVRTRLHEKYGAAVPAEGPIPAHLLGNMWSQGWTNIYPLVAPPQGDSGYDLTEILKSRNTDAVGMVKFGERFFVSLGFDPLPDTFWKRSMFTRPRDREVVCHASAWSIDFRNDLRVKMCIQINDEDFTTVHHELGHNFYQRAYNQLPPLFQSGANDGFHEAVGDTIALSITPEYLHEIGLLDKMPGDSGDLGFLMKHALDKVAFLPFGLLIDQWRWKVFSGEIKPADYNKTWWELKRKYQGVVPPVERSEADFDPAAKYHVASNVPYTRYFLAAVYQYQFHRALCKAAGFTGPLHRCSIYNNKAAGARLKKMLEMGESKPWPDALEAVGAGRELDASAILEYYAPLKKWLDEQNAGHPTGW
jgi:peptidyl-dipeptidase A